MKLITTSAIEAQSVVVPTFRSAIVIYNTV